MAEVSIWVQWLGGAIGVLLNSAFVVLLGWFIGWSHFSPVVAAPEGRASGSVGSSTSAAVKQLNWLGPCTQARITSAKRSHNCRNG
jgi:hypothetical protein